MTGQKATQRNLKLSEICSNLEGFVLRPLFVWKQKIPDFKELYFFFFPSFGGVGESWLQCSVSWCVSLKCVRRKSKLFPEEFFTQDYSFIILALPHVLLSLKYTFEYSILGQRVSGLDNIEYSQSCSLLWRFLLCLQWLSFDRSSGAIIPARDVIIILKFWWFRKMSNVWKCWLKYYSGFFYSCVVQKRALWILFFFLNTVFKKCFWSTVYWILNWCFWHWNGAVGLPPLQVKSSRSRRKPRREQWAPPWASAAPSRLHPSPRTHAPAPQRAPS